MISFHLQKTLNGPDGPMSLEIQGEIETGQLISLYGSSGAGKTSVLRMLAGLLRPDRGHIRVDEEQWFDDQDGYEKKTQDRQVGFVFQDYALFPNMSVHQNLRFAAPGGSDKKIIAEVAEILEIDGLLDRKPGLLSGGQKQRVALARAIVQRPFLLLLDEPLAATDHSLRLKLQKYISTIHQNFKLTTVLVSHDIGEIFKLSDEVYHLEGGKVIRRGPPMELFSNFRASGKFQFSGEVLGIEKQDVVYVVTVLVGETLVRVVADERETENLTVGNKVWVATKAFNPLIQKVDD